MNYSIGYYSGENCAHYGLEIKKLFSITKREHLVFAELNSADRFNGENKYFFQKTILPAYKKYGRKAIYKIKRALLKMGTGICLIDKYFVINVEEKNDVYIIRKSLSGISLEKMEKGLVSGELEAGTGFIFLTDQWGNYMSETGLISNFEELLTGDMPVTSYRISGQFEKIGEQIREKGGRELAGVMLISYEDEIRKNM